MTEHERLKRICDEIWYELPGHLWIIFYKNRIIKFLWQDMIFKKKYNCSSSQGWISYENKLYMIVDIREIIFTPEFMDKFIEYLSENEILTSSIEEHNIYYRLMKNNLHNPVTYLYNLISNK